MNELRRMYHAACMKHIPADSDIPGHNPAGSQPMPLLFRQL
jgi:hypothetical protein